MSILSLVIPTRNRHEYLNDIIQAFLSLNDKRISLVIHDNSDNEINFKSTLETNNIKYIYTNEKLSMHENFSRALSYADSKYVCMSGDDDFLSHYISNILDFLDEHNVDALISYKVARYWWKDVRHKTFRNFLANQLRVPWHKKALSVSKISSQDAMNECLRSGGTEISMLPKLYHGIVSSDLIRSIEFKYGNLFTGPTPDMAAAALIALCTKNTHIANQPFFISGTAGGSAGGKGVQKQHSWSLKEVPWFEKKYIEAWNKNTPEIACGPTLWAEGVLQAYALVNIKPNINWIYLYARTMIEGKLSIKYIVYKAKRNNDLPYSQYTFILILFFYIFKFYVKRAISFFENLSYMIFGFSWNGNSFKECKSPMHAVNLIKQQSKLK